MADGAVRTGRGWRTRALLRLIFAATLVPLSLGAAGAARGQDATPGASPMASPMASPAASPAAFGADAATGLTFGLIQKSGDQEYFVDEAQGFREIVEGAGGEVIVQDVQLNSDAAINAVDTLIGSGVAGIAIVVPDQQIGPAVIDKARQANIPLIALDDVIKDASGADAPFAGFDGTQMGTAVGQKAAELWAASGWGEEGVGVLSIEVPTLTVCTDRTTAAKQMMTDAGFPADNIVTVPYDGTAPAAIDAAATTVTANPQFTKYVVFACNDEGVQGGLRALGSAGITPDNILGVGLGGYLACPEFKSGEPTGFKAALFIDGLDVGRSGAQALLAAATQDAPLPPKTIAPTTMTTPEDYASAGLSC